MSNAIQYTSRTFNTVLNDINSDVELVDTPNWWKNIIAGSHDVLDMYINAMANLSNLRTAFTRQAVCDLCALIDYYLAPQATASGNLIFYFNALTVIFPKTVALVDIAARSQGSVSASSLKYEARAGATITAFSEGFTTNFAVNSELTMAGGRTYTTGEKVRVATDNTLPAPLMANTDYYVIYVAAATIKLSQTLTDAYNGTSITLTSDGAGNHTATLYSFIAVSYQQETQEQFVVGTSDGITSWQRFDLQHLDVIDDTLTILINSDTWTRVDSLTTYTSTDKVFLLRYNTDNSSYILFGDGVYGKIPGNFDIYATYATGGGLVSNISNVNRINVYSGSDSDIVGVSNPVAFTGGSDPENIELAKVLAPILLKARDRFVTQEDGKARVLNYGGVTRCIINKNVYGLLSCQVPIVPAGGGVPGGALKTAIQTYLINKTILEMIDVRVVDPTYITVTPVVQIHVLTGYLFANIKPFIKLALHLLFSEVTYEYYQDYIQNGIESTVVLINAKWTFSFGEADYTQIELLLNNVTPTDFGLSFQESDVLSFLDNFVYGIDYLTISAPAFPVVIASDEISTDDVLNGNITEIP